VNAFFDYGNAPRWECDRAVLQDDIAGEQFFALREGIRELSGRC
jgi:hypothetical protein